MTLQSFSQQGDQVQDFPSQQERTSRALSLLVDAAAKVEPIIRDDVTSNDKSQPNSDRNASFPVALMRVLSDPANSEIISFLPDGSSFAVLRPKAFESDLMPRYFRATKFASFVRNLNRWGFRRVDNRGHADHGSFKHPMFRRGEWETCRKIKCQQHRRQPTVPFPPRSRSHAVMTHGSCKQPFAVRDRIPKNLPSNASKVQFSSSDEGHRIPKNLSRSASEVQFTSSDEGQRAQRLRSNKQEYEFVASNASKILQTFSYPQETVNDATHLIVGAAVDALVRGETKRKTFALSQRNGLSTTIKDLDYMASNLLQRSNCILSQKQQPAECVSPSLTSLLDIKRQMTPPAPSALSPHPSVHHRQTYEVSDDVHHLILQRALAAARFPQV